MRGTECSLFIFSLSLSLSLSLSTSIPVALKEEIPPGVAFFVCGVLLHHLPILGTAFFFVNPEMHLASTRPEHGTLVSCCRNVGSRIFPFAERIEINKGSARPDRV